MMSTIIQIPDSVYDYLTDSGIQSVVDHLLEQGDNELPEELAWDEVRAFHEAYLSAQKVKTDYVLWLMDLWDAIWQPALDKQEIHFKPWMPREMKEWDAEPSRQTVWYDAIYHRWFSNQMPNGKFEFDTRIEILHEKSKLQLFFRVDNGEEEIIPKQFDWQTTLKDWEFEEDDCGYLITSQELLPTQANSKQLDLTQLATLAEDIMTQTMTHLKKWETKK
ncbi:conserved hypothetical protein [Beggiatoa sp. PS]|nr:conserved hypothetical protein [Beggiatoa sp. PS]